jgi:hypothetical protein
MRARLVLVLANVVLGCGTPPRPVVAKHDAVDAAVDATDAAPEAGEETSSDAAADASTVGASLQCHESTCSVSRITPAVAAALAARPDRDSLTVYFGAPTDEELWGVDAIPWLRHLVVRDAERITNLRGLAPLTTLESLEMVGGSYESLAPLGRLSSLARIDITAHVQDADLSALASLGSLTQLRLAGIDDAKDFSPIAKLKHLEALDLSVVHVRDLAFLRGLDRLKVLDLYGDVADLSAIAGLKSLEELHLLLESRPVSLAPIGRAPGLKKLLLSGDGVDAIPPLAGSKELEEVDVSGPKIKSTSAFVGASQKLRVVRVTDTGIADVSPLAGLTGLEELDLDRTPVVDIAPLAKVGALKRIQVPIDFPGEKAEAFMKKRPDCVVAPRVQYMPRK